MRRASLIVCGLLAQLPLASLGSLGSLTSSAAAAPVKQTAKLQYTRGEGAQTCPDEPTLRASVAARLGYDPFVDAGDTKVVVVAMIHDSKGFHGQIDVRDKDGVTKGTRRLDAKGSDCGELAGAITLAISIAVDPMAGLGGGSSAPLPLPPLEKDDEVGTKAAGDDAVGGGGTTVTSTSTSTTTNTSEGAGEGGGAASAAGKPEDIPADLETKEPVPDRRLLVSGGVITSLGYQPNFGVGATLGAALRFPSASIGLEGRADLATEQTYQASLDPNHIDSVTVQTAVLLASLLPCLHEGVVLVCANFSLGSHRTTASSSLGLSKAASLHASIGARMGVEVPVGRRVMFRFTLDTVFNLTRAELTFGTPATELWVSPQVAGALGAALVGNFL